MAKTNFSKAEEVLSDTLQKINKDKLLEMADSQAGTPVLPNPQINDQIAQLKALIRELKKLYRLDKEVYKKINIKKKNLENYLANFNAITPDEWKLIGEIKERVDAYIKEHPPEQSDDQQIENERLKHINKRLNVNDKWLPLQ